VRFAKCYCSPKLRARQMAEVLFTGAPTLDERLVEIGCGEFEGTAETPEAFRAFMAAMQDGSQGVEPFRAFLKRNLDFCDVVAAECAVQDILLVTHAANTRVMNYYFTGKPADYDFTQPVCQNGEILIFGGKQCKS